MDRPPWTALKTRAKKAIRRVLVRKGEDPDSVYGQPVDPRLVATLAGDDLAAEKGCGEVTILEVTRWLHGHGLRLGTPRYDILSANVYADWLDDHDEPAAAAKLRAAFPLDNGEGG